MFKWLTEKCGGGWKKAARHTNLRKTKFRKGCFSELWKLKAFLSTQWCSISQYRDLHPKRGKRETLVHLFQWLFLNLLRVKISNSGFLRVKILAKVESQLQSQIAFVRISSVTETASPPVFLACRPDGNFMSPDWGLQGWWTGLGMGRPERLQKPRMEWVGSVSPFIRQPFVVLLVKLTIKVTV